MKFLFVLVIHRHHWFLWLIVGTSLSLLNSRVLADTANALDYGPQPADATDAIQAAIDSGAARVLIPYKGTPWIVGPLFARASNQEIVLEPGVELMAKSGAFRAEKDVLLTIKNVSNVTITGYGATIRMRKTDYQNPALYTPSEHRHALDISCVVLDANGNEIGPGVVTSHIIVQGLTLADSGGDGICLSSQIGYRNGTAPSIPQFVTLRDLVCDNNHRQGISIIGADTVTLQDSVLQNTRGTPPQAGADLEPDWAPMRNITVRNTLSRNNRIKGFSLFLYRPAWKGDPRVSILMDRCHADGPGGQGIPGTVQRVPDDLPGSIIWRDSVLRSIEVYGVMEIESKSALGASLTFERCLFDQVNSNPNGVSPLAIVGDGWTDSSGNGIVAVQPGGVNFMDCVVNDSANRPFLTFSGGSTGLGVRDIIGTITVHNPFGATQALGAITANCTLAATAVTSRAPQVKISGPAHLSEINLTSTLMVTAISNDPDIGPVSGAGIEHIVFSVRRNQELVATAIDATAPYSAAFDTTTWAEGIYLVRATTRSWVGSGINEDAIAVKVLKPARPNLRVQNIAFSSAPTLGSPTSIQVTLINMGNRSTSEAVVSTIQIGSQIIDLPPTPRILGSQEPIVVSSLWTPSNVGFLTTITSVDPFAVESESNETDNSFTQTILVANTYLQWINSYSTLSGAAALANADPDGDGLANLIEYALDSSPISSAGSSMPTAEVEGENLKFQFPRISANTDIDYSVEASDDLRSWVTIASSILGSTTTADNVVTASEVGMNTKIVTILDPMVINNGASRFVRLKVVHP